ncbi:glycosyltransferase [Nonlabens sp.]|uniref:glycosyltransferase n=1 Tax=Nonlabens sp. TaxID=1888209 RepID=UPI003F69C193
MRLLIISDAPVLTRNGKKEAYAPYVREMDLWMKYVDHTTFICPTIYHKPLLTQSFAKQDFTVNSLRRLEFHAFFNAIWSLCNIPYQFVMLCLAFAKADHIHLRCPGNLALLACIAQMFFPSKTKSAKYAGNWDPKATQPLAYRLQKKILSNERWTKNIKVLVYGQWPNQSNNIIPFFTASYHEKDKKPIIERNYTGALKAVYVGTLSDNKRPLQVLEMVHELRKSEIDISLDLYGDGPLKETVIKRIKELDMTSGVTVHGNQPLEVVTQAYKTAHFSFLLSKSEGWPKAVAEAMFWGCIPIASKVSCVPWMLGFENFQIPNPKSQIPNDSRTSNASSSSSSSSILKETYPLGLGKGFGNVSSSTVENDFMEHPALENKSRGILIDDLSRATATIQVYLQEPDQLDEMSQQASKWSQQYTLDEFEKAIQELLKDSSS